MKFFRSTNHNRSPRYEPSGAAAMLIVILSALASLLIVLFIEYLTPRPTPFIPIPLKARAQTESDFTITLGEEEIVFNWDNKCNLEDIPDMPIRGFFDRDDRIQLLAGHYEMYRMRGAPGERLRDVTGTRRECGAPVFKSSPDSDPSKFKAYQWIHGTFTEDGEDIYALMNDEYHGWEDGWLCDYDRTNWQNCQFPSITYSLSTDSGASYKQKATPNHFIGTIPYRYDDDSDGDGNPDYGFGAVAGFWMPSNIIKKDGYYYNFFQVPKYRKQAGGTCMMRHNPNEPKNAWTLYGDANGDKIFGFEVTPINPYTYTGGDWESHVCAPVGKVDGGSSCWSLGRRNENVTWNTYLNKYVFVGIGSDRDPETGEQRFGYYYALSDDLLCWAPPVFFKAAVVNENAPGHDKKMELYPVLMDDEPYRNCRANPGSCTAELETNARNFGVTGQNPYLYHGRWKKDSARDRTYDRDLIRIPLTFTLTSTADTNPPTVAITKPFPGEVVAGTITISATASDDAGVRDVQFFVDNGLIQTDGAAPYEIQWNTNTVQDGFYTISAIATDTSGNSGSASVPITVRNTALPRAPSDLEATAVSSSQIDLVWQDNADNELGFKIERSTESDSGFMEIQRSGAESESWSDTGLLPDTTYWYRVRAYNDAGHSSYSNITSATTLQEDGEDIDGGDDDDSSDGEEAQGGKTGDLNSDSQVNVLDLSILLTKWGTSDAAADLNQSGAVDIFDLSTLLSRWGQ